MDYFYLIQDIIDYIEDNLMNNLTIDSIAEHFTISKFHFQRLFKAATNENLIFYIRKRILSESLKELHSPHNTILDVALKYNYNSHEAYSRAFKKYFSITPGEYVRNGVSIEPYTKINCINASIMKKTGNRLFKIEETYLPEMNFITVKNDTGKITHSSMVETWGSLLKNTSRMDGLINPDVHYNILNDGTYGENLSFIAGIQSLFIDTPPSPLLNLTIPPQKYISFYHKGKTIDLQTEGATDTIDLIFKIWLSITDYELDSRYVSLIGITDETNFLDKENDTVIHFLLPVKD